MSVQQERRTPLTDWHKTFVVAVVTRGDLTEAGLSAQQIDALTDADMQSIAEKMADLYCDNGYWQDVKSAVEKTLAGKGGASS
jgi:hypothetical protein